MGWSQRLGADHYAEVQEDVRQAAEADGLDAVLLDDPEDVAYLTGFFHHPTERPVAVLLGTDGATVLLLPELEREYAEARRAAAALVSSPESPGGVPPFEVLADKAPVRGRLGYAASTAVGRLAAVESAFGSTQLVATEVVAR